MIWKSEKTFNFFLYKGELKKPFFYFAVLPKIRNCPLEVIYYKRFSTTKNLASGAPDGSSNLLRATNLQKLNQYQFQQQSKYILSKGSN